MIDVDSTPAFVAGVYRRMEVQLATVRARLRRPLCLAEKILLAHLDEPDVTKLERGRTYVRVRPDRVLLQDVLGQTAMLQFMQTRRARTAVPTTIHCDHLVQARVGGSDDLLDSLHENDEVYAFLRAAAARYGVGFWEPGAGIIHQVALENYAFPGQLMIGTDSHTPNGGGLGSLAVGVGGVDAVEVMAGLPWEVLYPRVIGVHLSGVMSGWTAPKDVILKLAGILTVSGGTNAVIEYFGPGAHSISATGKATITNMGAELGATTSMFPYDERMAAYLDATNRHELVELADRHRHLLAADDECESDPQTSYDRVVELDLSRLEPHVSGPHSPDRVRPISQLAAEVADPGNHFVDEIATALIGSCTNSSYQDMSRSADIARQALAHGVRTATALMVTPGSEQIRATIERDGQMGSLREVGGMVLANACGPCIGQWRRGQDATAEPNTIVTSYNRNFSARNDGAATTMNFIASPEIVTALALAGRLSFNPLTDALIDHDGKPFMLTPPEPTPDVPSAGYESGRSAFVPPPDDGSGVELVIDPTSERLQLLQPWDRWDGEDLVEMPVLVKTCGKTTTDQISPAGPWLRFRGHLDRFSDNMLMGAVNAYTGATGTVTNVLSGRPNQRISDVARVYADHDLRWVVVGDHNYGEGSSREHAALSPRLLGGAAVIARSFARIHETNLKKQGLLALTFDDPRDYDRFCEDDLLSIVGLRDLAPGEPVTGILRHGDGTSEELVLRHSYSASQLDWFRAGAALNVLDEHTGRRGVLRARSR